MTAETKVFCPAGKGICPTECPIYPSAKELSKLPAYRDMSPMGRRARLVFGDAYSHEVNVIDVARALGSCTKKDKPLSR